MSKGFIIFSIITGLIGTACSLFATVDQVKNGNKRAILTGDAAGRAVVDESQKRHITLFGMKVDEDGKITV